VRSSCILLDFSSFDSPVCCMSLIFLRMMAMPSSSGKTPSPTRGVYVPPEVSKASCSVVLRERPGESAGLLPAEVPEIDRRVDEKPALGFPSPVFSIPGESVERYWTLLSNGLLDCLVWRPSMSGRLLSTPSGTVAERAMVSCRGLSTSCLNESSLSSCEEVAMTTSSEAAASCSVPCSCGGISEPKLGRENRRACRTTGSMRNEFIYWLMKDPETGYTGLSSGDGVHAQYRFCGRL
jgi:hypothetical protein